MTIINHETYCGQDLVVLLIKTGFDWKDYFVAHSIDEHFHWEIPLHIAQRWLRDVKNVYLYAYPDFVRGSDINPVWQIKYKYKTEYWAGYYDTYEEALEAGIKKCLTIILEEKNEREEG